LKAGTNRNEFPSVNGILSGSDGLVYLAFLGRETYATHIQGSFVPSIYKNAPSVNQTVKRLLKYDSEFLIFKKEERGEGKGGKARKIYTANFDPIFLTLQAHDVKFDERELRDTIGSLSLANDYFPRFLLNLFDCSLVMKSSWHLTLSNYFTFLSHILRSSDQEELYSFMLHDVTVDMKKIEALFNEFPELAKKFDLMAMKITLPGFSLNPQFESFLFNSVKGFDRIMSDSKLIVNFFRELQKMGITNLEDHFSELVNRLQKAEEFLANLDKLKDKLKEALQRKKYKELEKLINSL